MKVTLMAVALLALLLTTIPTTGQIQQERDNAAERITPDEEREARELLEEFDRKFAETHDIAPLIKEYFVSDFASRLNRHAETFPLQLVEWKDNAAPPEPDDLLRFYVASTNCLQTLFPLIYAAYQKAEKARGADGEMKDPTPYDVLPPAAIELIKSEPLLREVWDALDEQDEQKADDSSSVSSTGGDKRASDEDGQKENDEKGKIDNAEKLRHITSIIESVAKILREHLKAHPVTFERINKGGGERVNKDEDEESDDGDDGLIFDPAKTKIFESARILSGEFYGYPKGTRLVCANAGALHAEMVRVDGRLRILTVFLLVED
jgi:hypothetical protein